MNTVLDAATAPLSGACLIEASAGTGKTYTLTSLFLRLLMEKGLLVEQILVVTFTVAAAQELKDRVRRRLRIAQDAYAGKKVDDPFVEQIVKDSGPRGLLQVEDALRRFDAASIFTIHGFCQRVLGENAFESGASFDADLAVDTEGFWQETARDFWRKEFTVIPEDMAAFLAEKKRDIRYYDKLLRDFFRHPGLVVIPQVERPSLDSRQLFAQAREAVAAAWPQARDEVEQCLLQGGLNGKKYGVATAKPGEVPKRITKVKGLMGSMDAYLAGPVWPVFDGLDLFSTDDIKSNTKKDCTPPKHRFFDLCQDLKAAAMDLEAELTQYLLYLDWKLHRHALEAVPARKKEQDILFFDDLVSALQKALEGSRGPGLTSALQKKYKAALIDEFQDTDTAQYAIFHRVFSRLSLFMIGDPKQAIYGFRGADLFSYIRASKNAGTRLSLENNWRSSPRLIQAVNTVFSQGRNPFVLEDIRFTPAKPAPVDRGSLDAPDLDPAPLQAWLLDAGQDKAMSKGNAQEITVKAVTSEISRLLALGRQGKAMLKNQPLSEGDIAVLVRSHREAQAIQDSLRRAGIASVLHRTGNLFDTAEAMEMRRFLEGAAQGDIRTVRSALCAPLMGVTARRLDNLEPGGEALDKELALFSAWQGRWRKSGFMAMFADFMNRCGVRTRLLGQPGGERSLTNILHLAEVLHQAEREGRLGVSGLCQWLDRRMDPATPRLDEHQLRLESDAMAVQVVTMHGSKGLEYPVVFCPFLWEAFQAKDRGTFHDPENDFAITLDLDPSPAHQSLMQREAQAEEIRLAYVALTRARRRCYTAWGKVNKADSSALAHLLHDCGPGSGKAFKDVTSGEVLAQLQAIEEASEGSIRTGPPPAAVFALPAPGLADNKPLAPAVFTRPPETEWRVTSFSTLSSAGHESGKSGLDEAPAPFFQPGEPEEEEPALTPFSFPKGPGPGLMLHDLLEHLDFTDADPERVHALALEKLQDYGLDSQWAPVACSMVDGLLACPLDPAVPGLALNAIPLAARANEMEFYFPVRKITPAAFDGLFPQGSWPTPARDLDFDPVKGYVHGFMDMVFTHQGRYYLVDWKSNHLGDSLEDYGRESMARAMAQHQYFLQYHLYTLALDLHLAQRLPDYDYEIHFGGVYYVFLRGADPGRKGECGIFRDRPSLATLNLMKERLLPG